jgi:hypothetical protein
MIALVDCLEITVEAQTLGLLSPAIKFMHSFCRKNGLGYILGNFFTNLSGHPG